MGRRGAGRAIVAADDRPAHVEGPASRAVQRSRSRLTRPRLPIRSVTSPRRVVIAHEWLTAVGGSDKTVAAMARALPEAKVVTAIADPATVAELFPDATSVEALWTNRLPQARRRWRSYSPAVILAWSMFQAGEAEVLISSSHFAARAAGSRFRGQHLCYCYTPMRVAWRPDLELSRLPPRIRPAVNAALPAIRAWDRRTARNVAAFAGISTTIVERIRDAYDRDAVCLFPPVDVAPFTASARRSPPGYFLAFGRLIPYKRFDLAVQACTEAGYDLIVAGTGPDEGRLRAMAGPSVRFVGRVDDSTYLHLLAGATALLFPGEEDFGIVPVEAQAAGCPVVALGRGGALDTVSEGETGVLFPEPTVASLRDGIDAVLSKQWDEVALRRWASQFSEERFAREMRSFVDAHG
jgi:glycosyltransferase involved in cell wall biosynthesis